MNEKTIRTVIILPFLQYTCRPELSSGGSFGEGGKNYKVVPNNEMTPHPHFQPKSRTLQQQLAKTLLVRIIKLLFIAVLGLNCVVATQHSCDKSRVSSPHSNNLA